MVLEPWMFGKLLIILDGLFIYLFMVILKNIFNHLIAQQTKY